MNQPTKMLDPHTLDQGSFKPWRKKPVVVHAVQWAGFPIWIPTLEGPHLCSTGDWIVRGVKGEFYPVKPDIFALTYEADQP